MNRPIVYVVMVALLGLVWVLGVTCAYANDILGPSGELTLGEWRAWEEDI